MKNASLRNKLTLPIIVIAIILSVGLTKAQSPPTAQIIELLQLSVACPLPCDACDLFRPPFGDSFGIRTQSLTSNGKMFQHSYQNHFKLLNETTRKLDEKLSSFQYRGNFQDILIGQPHEEDIGDRFTTVKVVTIKLACTRTGCLHRDVLVYPFPDRGPAVINELDINFCSKEAAQNAKMALDELVKINRSTDSNSGSPRFDCSKSLQSDEAAICGNSKLAALDQQLNEAYRAAAKLKDRNRLLEEQKAWLSRRHGCEADQACISAAYLSRIDELKQ